MVRFTCTCGKQLQARAEFAGRLTRCPQCGREQEIPAESADVLDVLPASPPSTPEPAPEPAEARQRFSRLAVLGAVLGVFGVFPCFALTGLPGLIVSIFGLREISGSRGRLRGRGYAIAGIILGSLSLVLSLSRVPAGLIGLLLPAGQ
jgi:hypothetical protein